MDILSALSGKVLTVKDEVLKGTVVTVEHENGVKTIYTGVYDVTVKAGDDIEQGDVIGKTGTSQLEPDSGNVVHFEVMKDNNKLNPEDVINTKLGDL